MGKKGNWFSAVKKAFSPSKDGDKEARSNAEQQKKPPKEKKRWTFGRSSQHESTVDVLKRGRLPSLPEKPLPQADEDQNKHALAVAAATAAAAEAAVAAAQAAAEVVRLTGGARSSLYYGRSRDEYAAIKIQAAFRGYLARRALRALKGLVRLQALVRGHTVRRQATVTLRCMQALVRVQAQVRSRRARLADESKASERELWQKQQRDNGSRRSLSDATPPDDWDDSARSADEAQTQTQLKQQASIKRDRALSYATSHQLWKAAPNLDSLILPADQDKSQWGWSWLERWMAGRSWDGHSLDKDCPEVSSVRSLEEMPGSTGRPSAILRSGPPQNVSTLSSKPAHIQLPAALQTVKPVGNTAPSASPHSVQTLDEEGSAISTSRNTHSLVSAPQRFSSRHSAASSSVRDDESLISYPSIPGYMASTQSAKAKVRSHSTPKQRPGTPEKDHLLSAKKRLSFPPEPSTGASGPLKPTRPPGTQRSPSFKGHSGPLKIEHSLNETNRESIPSLNGDIRRHYK